MYVNDEYFNKWMEKLYGAIREMGKDLKSFVNTNDVFDSLPQTDNPYQTPDKHYHTPKIASFPNFLYILLCCIIIDAE